ncbi:MAG: putative protease/transporter [Acidobacteria bacterium]|nr:putative protease/transporter [Acidobacteriota bacterium]
MVLAFVFVGLILSLSALFLAGLSRHKKSATGDLKIIGAIGSVESGLDPEGSVIINGELWRARLEKGGVLPARDRVRVVGLQGHLILVEPLSN